MVGTSSPPLTAGGGGLVVVIVVGGGCVAVITGVVPVAVVDIEVGVVVRRCRRRCWDDGHRRHWGGGRHQ